MCRTLPGSLLRSCCNALPADFPVDPWASLVLCAPHSHMPPHCSWLLMPVPDGGEDEPLQMAAKHAEKASLTLWVWEKPQT